MVADPRERQIRDRLLVLVELVEQISVAGRDDHVVVGQHHALRAARRARRVENDAEIGALALRDRFLPARKPSGIRELLAPDLLHIIHPGQLAAIVVAQAARLVIDQMAQGRDALGDRDHLVDLLLVLHHRDGDLGVLQHVGHLVGDRIRVDRHRHGAEGLARAHRPVKPRPVRTDYGELVAALEPQLLQADREGADVVEHLGPRPGLPDAEVLVAHRDAAAARFRVLNQELRKGIRTGALACHDRRPSVSPGLIAARLFTLAAVDRRSLPSLRHMK